MHIHFNYPEHNCYLETSLEWDVSILLSAFYSEALDNYVHSVIHLFDF